MTGIFQFSSAHLRTSNPVESAFATLRLRQRIAGKALTMARNGSDALAEEPAASGSGRWDGVLKERNVDGADERDAGADERDAA